MKKIFKKEKLVSLGYGIFGLAAFLLFWWLVVRFTSVGNVLPSPFTVFAKLFDSITHPIGKHTLLVHLGYSIGRVMIGYTAAAILGIITGLAMAQSETANAIIRPLFAIIRPIPGITWMPLAILWFGIGSFTKIFIIFVGGFAHMVINTYAGAKRADQQLIGAALMLGATKRQLFSKVILPSTVPYIFAGLQVSLSSCWMAVLAAEMISSTEGAGWIIVAGQDNGNITQVIVGVIAIAIVGLILANAMRATEHRLCAWAERGR